MGMKQKADSKQPTRLTHKLDMASEKQKEVMNK